MIINWLTEHAKDSTKYLRSAAKEDFEKACNISSDLREARGFKIRIALRCRAVIDKLFIEGANQYELYTQQKLHAIWHKKPAPPEPTPKNIQRIRSSHGEIFGYIPLKFAKKVYKVSKNFQARAITSHSAIKHTQLIADEISYIMGLEKSFEVLDFLREELKTKTDK